MCYVCLLLFVFINTPRTLPTPNNYYYNYHNSNNNNNNNNNDDRSNDT